MKIPRILAFSVTAQLFTLITSHAQTWDGGGIAGGVLDWSTAANWNLNVAPLNDGTANIIFAGTIDNNPGPNMDQNWNVNSVTFNNTAGAFVLGSAGGFTLTIQGGGITNSDVQSQTITHSITLGAAQAWSTTGGPMGFTGPSVNNGGNLLTVAGGFSMTIGSAISGGGGLTKTSTGALTLSGATANTYTGTTTVNAGTLFLSKTAGINAIVGPLVIGDGSGTDTVQWSASNQIANTTVTVNSSGVLDLNGFSEGFLSLVVDGGSTTIGAGSLSLGTSLTMTGGSVSSTTGALVLQGLLNTNAAATSASISGNLDLGAASRIFTIADGAVAIDLDVSAVVANGSFSKTGAGALRLSGANTFSGTFDLNAGTVLVGNNAAFGTSTVRLNGGTIQADGVARTLANNVELNGSFSVGGTLALDLNGPALLTGNHTLTVASSGGSVNLSGVLSESAGGFTFTKDGVGAMVLDGAAANTFSGLTFVKTGSLFLAKSAGNAIAGNLLIGDEIGAIGSDFVRNDQPNQILDTANVEVRNTGNLFLNFAETIGSLTLEGGSVSGGATLTLNGGVTGVADAQTATISVPVNLGGALRTFNIADGAAANDLLISGVISNGAIFKDGAGTLRLTGANTFSGGTTLNAGTLAFGSNGALGGNSFTINGGTILADGAPRVLTNPVVVVFNAGFTIGGTQDLEIPGTILINATTPVAVNNTGVTTFSGGILTTPAVTLRKTGPGTLVLAGSAANDNGTSVQVMEGTLVLNKPAGVQAVATLNVGDALGGFGADIARLAANEQISDTSTLGLSASGLFDLNGFNETVSVMNLVGGAQITTGAGLLTVAGTVVTAVSGTAGANIAGNLSLGGGTRNWSVVDNVSAANDVEISAAISNGGMNKFGVGTLRFSGAAANTLTGPITVNDGALVLAKTAGVNAIAGALTIGDGVGAVNTDIVTFGASDQIPNASLVTINNSGLLNLAGFNETLNEVVFAGGSIATGAGALRFDFNHVGVTTNASFRNATISGNILLDGGGLFLTTADGSAAIDLDISATISQGAFSEGVDKDGPGLLRLSGNNTFSNGVGLYAGTLAIGSNGALGTLGELYVYGPGTVRADGAARTIASIFVVPGASALVDGNLNLTLSSVLDLPAGTSLTKSQTGSLILQNPIPNWNGTLTLTNGTLDAGAQTIRAAGLFAQNSGTFIGTLTNLGTFTYSGGNFTGQLVNQGTANFNANFTAANGIANTTTINLGNGIVFTANGTGLANDGTLTLSNSTLAGAGPLVSNNFLSGFGTIGGTGGFTNNGLITISGGNLVIANTGANVNAGNIDVPIVRQLRLDAGLANTGTITLASTSITGAATLTNSAGGIVSGRGTISAPLANSGGTLRAEGGTLTVANAFNNSGVVRAEDGATVIASSIANQAGGLITLLGTLSTSGSVTNATGARIDLRNGTGQLGGAGALANAGLITGDGTIAKSFTNNSGGEVRAELGKTLLFSGSPSPNAGTLALQGGTLDFTSALTNSATGFITGRGALHTGGLTNDGVLAFSGGTADIFGDTTNAAGARIVTSGGGSVTTFYDDVTHNGLEIFTGAGASTVFFGDQGGAGSFTGTGTVYFNGDLRPGNSPASVLYEGDLVFGGASSLMLEIGGLSEGSEYDHLKIGGALHADGDLVLALIDGFTPQFGDTFDLLDVGTFAGGFDAITAPVLPGNLEWDFSALKTTGSVTVVPEPGVGALLASALGLLRLRRRTRAVRTN